MKLVDFWWWVVAVAVGLDVIMIVTHESYDDGFKGSMFIFAIVKVLWLIWQRNKLEPLP